MSDTTAKAIAQSCRDRDDLVDRLNRLKAALTFVGPNRSNAKLVVVWTVFSHETSVDVADDLTTQLLASEIASLELRIAAIDEVLDIAHRLLSVKPAVVEEVTK